MKKLSIESLALAAGFFATGGFVHADTLINTYGPSNITATASSNFNNAAATVAAKTIDGSGLNQTTGEHGNGTQQSWMSKDTDTLADTWIQWDLGSTYVLGSIKVWNYNDFSRFDSGTKELDIYVSALASPGDPEGAGAANWTKIGTNVTIPKATALTTYTGFDLETETGISLPGTAIRWVRFEVNSNYWDNAGPGNLLGENYAGLSEIQFFEASVSGPVDSKITSFSVSGDTATFTMTGDDSVDYWCASSTDLTGWSTEETILETGTATPIPSPFNTSGGTLTFDVDVTGDSKLFLRIQDGDPSP